MTRQLTVICLLLALGTSAFAQAIYSHGEHIELGDVMWYRDYDLALEESDRTGKPVLILFQEVPGCATCQRYGQQILSHPLLVESIQHNFIPLAIFNNKRGADATILEKYGEPSWNNPVVRIVDHKGSDLVDRMAGKYTLHQLLQGMVNALQQYDQKIPQYLQLLSEEWTRANLHAATFSMYCFWSGEAQLGSLDGVISVESGFQNGREVVRIRYDEDKIKKEDINSYADSHSMSAVKNTTDQSFRYSEKDHLYQLRHSPYRAVPMSTLQKVKVNAALYAKEDPKQYLSPQQLLWLRESSSKSPSVIDQDLAAAWSSKT